MSSLMGSVRLSSPQLLAGKLKRSANSSRRTLVFSTLARTVTGVKTPLSITHPELAAQLKDRSLADVLTYGSNKKVWWLCDKSHEWEAVVKDRTKKGSRCPYCCGRRVLAGFNDLATLRPDIACELKDQSLASQLTVGSEKKVRWVCKPHGHEYEAAPNHRTGARGSGCPYCSGNKVLTGFNDLGTLRPDVACELKDQSLTSQLTVGSEKKVWWVCKCCSNEWEASVVSRTGARGHGCPYCVGKKVMVGFNDLGTLRPDLACELKDPSLAATLTVYSSKKVWWVCKHCTNEWEVAVASRTNMGTGCPACATRGFNQTAPAWVYLVSQPSLHTEDAVIVKLGITNLDNLETRLAKHARQGLTEVLALSAYPQGSDALTREVTFKKYLRDLPQEHRVTKGELPDGWTEAFLSTAPDWETHAYK